MFDFIGDIHGYADKLTELLGKLGYSLINGVYSHPSRKVLFVGDYIDRGPKIRETLIIVRQMVESGNAIALLGNHEYNAICFHYMEREGGHLRKHLIKNILQHYETLKQFQNKQDEYNDYIEWFKTLPLYYETNDFRAVHACWDNDNIAILRKALTHNKLNEASIHNSVKKGTELYWPIEQTLKGKEITLPEGSIFKDKEATERNEMRIKWWQDPTLSTYRNISVVKLKNLPDQPIDLKELHSLNYYLPSEIPVFFGHYWLKKPPKIFLKNICCLDYSVAQKGVLAAYRFDGEKELSNEKFTFV